MWTKWKNTIDSGITDFAHWEHTFICLNNNNNNNKRLNYWLRNVLITTNWSPFLLPQLYNINFVRPTVRSNHSKEWTEFRLESENFICGISFTRTFLYEVQIVLWAFWTWNVYFRVPRTFSYWKFKLFAIFLSFCLR